MLTVDIAVVGGGLMGVMAALVACQQGYRVALLDTKPAYVEQNDRIPTRCFAIAPAQQAFLHKLGVWSPATRSCPYRHMIVRDGEGFGELAFEQADPLGYITEQAVLLNQGYAALHAYPHLCYLPQNTLRSLTRQAEHIILTTDTTTLCAALVVGADGVTSQVRQCAHIESTAYDYRQTALTATLELSHSHQHIAWQRFTSTGPIALLPLATPHHASLVWSSTLAFPTQGLEQAIAQQLDYYFGDVRLLTPPVMFPLSRQVAARYTFEHGLLLGNAAQHIHPLAGLGANLGLAQVECWQRMLQQIDIAHAELWHPAALAEYERQSRALAAPIMMMVDALNRLFLQTHSGIVWARSFGLHNLQKNRLLKKFFCHQANIRI